MHNCDLPAVDYLIFMAYPVRFLFYEKIWLCAEHFDNWGTLLGEKLKDEGWIEG
jgi:hypothetical protein